MNTQLEHVDSEGPDIVKTMQEEINSLHSQCSTAASAVADYLDDVGDSYLADNPEASDKDIQEFMSSCLTHLVDTAMGLQSIKCAATQLVIGIDGGVATDRFASRPVDLLIIDDDTEGTAPEDLNTIDGNEVTVSIRSVKVDSAQTRNLFDQADDDIAAKQHAVDERDGYLRDVRVALKELHEDELLRLHTKWCRQTFSKTSGNDMLPYSNGQGHSCCRGSLESSITYAAEMQGLEHVRQLHVELGLSDNEEAMSPS